MTPNSFAYIVFLVIGALIYHPLSQKAKKPFLLLLSICFYAIGGVKFLPLLALTVAFNFFAAQKLERTERKRGLLTLVLVLNLGALGLFKYLGFFGELLGCTGVQLSLPQLALPIGISFYTFVICGYMIDVYRGREAERNFLDFALFTTFFPAILSGPIERSKNLLPQIKQPRRATADDVRFAAERLIEGTVKKVLLADNLAILVNTAYADPAQFSGLELAFAAVAYALQIYCDFSAYSDMAIGSARLFGITLMENFHAPYMAQSSKEFWHRWHISLSPWFRDYLYFPLGGSRCSRGRMIFNLLVVWVATGLWHGAHLNFLLWGLGLFGILTVEKLWLKKYLDRWPVLGHLYMLVLIPLSWAVFSVSDLGQLGAYFGRLLPLFSHTAAAYPLDFLKYGKTYGVFLVLGLVCSTSLPAYLYRRLKGTWAGAVILAVLFWLWK